MLILLPVAMLIGVILPLQAGVNAQLRASVGHPVLAAFVSFAVGTLALLALSVFLLAPVPPPGALMRIPWWHWTGGLLGAVYVALVIVLAPRLGAATLIAALVAGQMVTSLLLDHFALVGYPPHPVNGLRMLGAALVIGGVLLIQRH
jgi:bacterial/archaeal transporter family-2 protein